MSEQGPYTVIKLNIQQGRDWWTIEDPFDGDYPAMDHKAATDLCARLNAAFAFGRLSASEQGKELILAGDAMAQELRDVLDFEKEERMMLGHGERASVLSKIIDWEDIKEKAKTAGEQPSQSSTEGVGDAASGPGQTGVPSSAIATDPVSPAPNVPIAGSSTATLCDRVGQHVFTFAGKDMPTGWACDCGATKFQP